MPRREQDTLFLQVGGKLYGGWKTMMVNASIETISGDFDLGYFYSWDGQEALPINDGDACEVRMGDDVVLTGYVDEATEDLGSDTHDLQVTGRDKTGDLVDCSAVHKPDQWSGQKLEAIAAILCKPFGISVKAETDTGAAFPVVKVQPGETAFAVIERLCRMRAVLPVSDGKGGLLLTAAGKGGRAYSALVEGENIKHIRRVKNQQDRFSDYIVKGQQSGLAAVGGGNVEVLTADGEVTTRAAAPASGKAKDAGITRYRPMLVVAEGEASGHSPQTRALWEATVRAGRGLRVEVTVQGWRQGDGALWRPNLYVHVKSPKLALEDTLLIASCAYSCNESGTITVLSLARPDAFLQLPPAKTKAASGLPPGTEIIGAGNA